MKQVHSPANILNCICVFCQTKFYEKPSRIKTGRGKFCSKLCYQRSQPWSPDYFWSKVNKTSTCWLWTGRLEKDGYGRIGGRFNRTSVHRSAWEMLRGPSFGFDVLHKCDIRNCVNPDHLFLGDNVSNTADMVSKNRQAKGERIASSVLTEEQVGTIKKEFALWSCKRIIATRYGVSPETINRILNGSSWRHIQ